MNNQNADADAADVRLAYEVSRMYHDALRNEILYKMRVQDQLGFVKLGLFAGTLAVGLTVGTRLDMDPSIAPYLYLLPLGLAILLDLIIIQNLRTLVETGQFLREQVENTWMACVKERMRNVIPGGDIVFWEQHVAAIRSKTTRLHFNAADLAQMLITLFIGLYCALELNEMMRGETLAAALWATRGLTLLAVLYLLLIARLYFPVFSHAAASASAGR